MMDKPQHTGFTLIELLIALSVLSLIGLATASALRYGVAAWRRSSSLEMTGSDLPLIRQALQRQLETAYPKWITDNPTNPHIFFNGTTNRLQFLASAPEALDHAGFAQYSLLIETSPDGQRLEERGERELSVAKPGRPPSILVQRAAHIEFSYFGKYDDRDPTWHSSWDGTSQLPQLIRLRVIFPSTDNRTWPDLIVAPHIAKDASCVYDALSKRCRGR